MPWRHLQENGVGAGVPTGLRFPSSGRVREEWGVGRCTPAFWNLCENLWTLLKDRQHWLCLIAAKPFVRNGDPSDPQAPFPYASPEKRVVRQHVVPTKTAIIRKWETTGVGEKLEPSPAAGGGEGGT